MSHALKSICEVHVLVYPDRVKHLWERQGRNQCHLVINCNLIIIRLKLLDSCATPNTTQSQKVFQNWMSIFDFGNSHVSHLLYILL